MRFFYQEVAQTVKRTTVHLGTVRPASQGSGEVVDIAFTKGSGQYLVGLGMFLPHQALDAIHHGRRFAGPGDGEDQRRAVAVIDDRLLLLSEG